MRSEDLHPSHHQCHGASALSSPPCTDVTPDHTSSSVSSPPPHTTDASGTVPPSSALRACVSVTLTPHPQQLVLLSIFYLTTGRKKLMTTATMVNDKKKSLLNFALQ